MIQAVFSRLEYQFILLRKKGLSIQTITSDHFEHGNYMRFEHAFSNFQETESNIIRNIGVLGKLKNES